MQKRHEAEEREADKARGHAEGRAHFCSNAAHSLEMLRRRRPEFFEVGPDRVPRLRSPASTLDKQLAGRE